VSSGSLASLREANLLRVIDCLRESGTASRADIARATGLSRTTVSTLVSDLQERGLVVEFEGDAGPRVGGIGGGRPPILLALDQLAGTALGVDFGHRHLRVALADLSSRVLAERRWELDVDRSALEALDLAAEAVSELLAETGSPRERIVSCGMGLPGPVDVTGQVGSSVILPGWAGLHAARELGRRIGLPVEVDNDANLGALGEIAFGAGRGVSDAIYVKASSGLGAGIVLGGRLHRGATGIAGEIGHIHADRSERVCRCGNRGCLETVAAVPALLELLRPIHGDGLTSSRLIALAQDGDLATSRLLADAGRAVGQTLAALCNALNPELIIVGGDLAATGDALLDGIRDSLSRFALPGAADAVRVTSGVLGDRAEVLGSLALVIGQAAHGSPGAAGSAGTPNPTDHHHRTNPAVLRGGGVQ
jgi:predicted NBD/HSP70 family sugar kinase/biotin operon repressor